VRSPPELQAAATRLSRARDDRRLAQAPWARKMGPMTETSARADEAGLEADLRAVAERHDREAFGRIFAFYAPRVKAYLRRLGAEDAVAEDLTQEAMLSVWRRAQQFDPRRAALSTWIFTIARNKRIDALRRDRRPDYDPEDPAIVEPVDDAPRGDQVAETEQIKLVVQRAIEKPALAREVERARDGILDGLSVGRVDSIIGLTEADLDIVERWLEDLSL